MKKRLLATLLALCTVLAMLPGTAFAATMGGTALPAGTTFTVNGKTVSKASGTALKNCSTYAVQILGKIWNVKGTMSTFNNQYNMLKGKSAAERKITADHVKSFIQAAPLGSRIRVCASSDTTTNNYDNSSKGHTLVLVAKDNAAGEFTVLHAGWGGSEATKYTYSNFASYYTKRSTPYNYFFYIANYSAADPSSTENDPFWRLYLQGFDTLTDPDNVIYTVPSVTDKKIEQVYIDGKILARDADYTISEAEQGFKIVIQKEALSGLSPDSFHTIAVEYQANNEHKRAAQNFKVDTLTDFDNIILNITVVKEIVDIYIDGKALIRDKDYTVSTVEQELKVAIRKDFLLSVVSGSSHSLAIEFGTNCILKRVAQDSELEDEYQITFNPNGGLCSTASKKVTANAACGTLPTPHRTGYTFSGWYTAKSGGKKVTASTKATANATLYAHWTKAKRTYQVAFNANGGDVLLENKSVVRGSAYQALPTPTRPGYHFTGWYTKASGGVKITDKTKVNLTANQTLYAHWSTAAVKAASTKSGNWRISVPLYYNVMLYSSNVSASPAAYISEKSSAQTLVCTRMAVLSNGTTRYCTKQNGTYYWFTYTCEMDVN